MPVFYIYIYIMIFHVKVTYLRQIYNFNRNINLHGTSFKTTVTFFRDTGMDSLLADPVKSEKTLFTDYVPQIVRYDGFVGNEDELTMLISTLLVRACYNVNRFYINARA